MKFGEKVRDARNKIHMSQADLAEAIGVSLRTVTNYELNNKYPKQREVYGKLAEVLQVDINYLLTEDEEFLLTASEKYGTLGQKQAQKMASELSCLFAGGELAEEDLDAMMKGLQEAYWIAKEKNQKKFSSKKDK